MARGAPDYAAVVAEILGARAYGDYTLAAAGTIPSETYTDVEIGTVPTGYEVVQGVNVISCKGCDTVHAMTLYVNSTVRRSSYFEVESMIYFPRYYVASAGEVMTVRWINWDQVSRHFLWSSIGILMAIGTPPLSPQLEAGPAPKLKKDETLWFVEDKLFGKRWIVAKSQKISKGANDILQLPKLKSRAVI